MAKTEDIEAKLAAYVDGQIDDAGRAEIEKHLASNPPHRHLIKELMQQRNLLRGLPHESAPPDVAESVNSQLERAVLLGDVDGDVEGGSMRLHRWSQLRAIAAILIFTASLASVIYYLLPSPNHKPQLATDLRPSASSNHPIDDAIRLEASRSTNGVTSPTTLPSNPIAIQDGAALPSGGVGVQATSQPFSEQQIRAALALRDDALGSRGGGIAIANPLRGQDSVVASNAAAPAVQMFQNMTLERTDAAASVLPLGQPSQVVWILSMADPQSAAKEVTGFLATADIRWETAAEPLPLPLDSQTPPQQMLASRLQSQMAQLKTGPATASATTAQSANMPATGPSAAQSNMVSDRNATTFPSMAMTIADATTKPERSEQRVVAKGINRMQAIRIRAELEQIRVRSVGTAQESLSMEARMPLATIGLNGFPPAEEFAQGRLRELPTLKMAVPSVSAASDLSNSPTIQPTTSTATLTLPEVATKTSIDADAPVTLAAVPAFNTSGENFTLAPSTSPSIVLKQPTTVSATSLPAVVLPYLGNSPASQPVGEVFDLVIVIQPPQTATSSTAPAATQPQ